MDQDSIIQYVTDTFSGLDILRPTDGPGADDTFIYYDPQRRLDPARRMPFATIVTKDYEGFDDSSHLNRPDVFRLKIGVSRDTFRSLFGDYPNDGMMEHNDHDFAALDRLMPHPAYARQFWVCVLNPGLGSFDAAKPLLADAYSRVASRGAASRQSP